MTFATQSKYRQPPYNIYKPHTIHAKIYELYNIIVFIIHIIYKSHILYKAYTFFTEHSPLSLLKYKFDFFFPEGQQQYNYYLIFYLLLSYYVIIKITIFAFVMFFK